MFRILAGKTERKERLQRLEDKSVNNIKMDLGNMLQGYMDFINLVDNRDSWRVVNTVINLRVSQNIGNFLSTYATAGF
jgi:hypothetical protein